MGFVLISLGGFLFWLSFWILLHIPDERVQRQFDSWLNQKLSKGKEEAEGYRVYTGAMVGVVLMCFALLLVVAGIIKLLY